jgi:hypothetical protein
MQVRAKEGRAMLAEKQDEAADGQPGEQEVDAEVLGAIHVRDEILACGSRELTAFFPERGFGADGPQGDALTFAFELKRFSGPELHPIAQGFRKDDAAALGTG